MLHQAPVFTSHENIDSYKRATSDVLWNYICQKWSKSNVDSEKLYKELLVILKSQNLSHNIWLFNTLHDHPARQIKDKTL